MVRRVALTSGLALAVCLLGGRAVRADPASSTVAVEGVDGAMLANVRAFVGLLKATPEELSDPVRRERLEASVAAEVGLALEPFGYYSATGSLEVDAASGKIRLIVDPGPPTRVSAVEILLDNAELEPELTARIDRLRQLAEGAVFDHSTYEDAKRAIQTALTDAGHLRAELLEHRVLVDRERRTAAIHLRWNVGPAHLIGKIHFVGAQFPPRFLDRYVDLKEGERYSRAAIHRFTRNLTDSPYFLGAEVIPLLDEAGEDLEVPLQVRITPMPRNLFEIGVSAGTDSGLGLEGLYERRWLNLLGHSFRTQLSPSVDRSTFTATYSIPSRKQLDRLYSVGFEALDETTRTNEKQNVAYSIVHQRTWKKWRRTSSLRYLDEDFVAGGEPGTSALLLVQGSFHRRQPRHEVVPATGWSLSAGFKLATEAVASDTSLLQIDLRAQRVTSFFESWRLLSQLQLGKTWVDDFELLPASLRYYAGGDRSLRGFDFESLGPRNEAGLVVGGENLAIVTLEVERYLTDQLRMATFVDYGNAFDTFDADELELGAGIGARLVTPIGMIRVDLAYPLTVDDPKLRLHFTLGPDL